jgi:hypothetical protein
MPTATVATEKVESAATVGADKVQSPRIPLSSGRFDDKRHDAQSIATPLDNSDHVSVNSATTELPTRVPVLNLVDVPASEQEPIRSDLTRDASCAFDHLFNATEPTAFYPSVVIETARVEQDLKDGELGSLSIEVVQ